MTQVLWQKSKREARNEIPDFYTKVNVVVESL